MLISQQGMILRMRAGDVRVDRPRHAGRPADRDGRGRQVVAVAKLAEKDDEGEAERRSCAGDRRQLTSSRRPPNSGLRLATAIDTTSFEV